MQIPYRIETDRLVIRCYDPRDAADMTAATNESLTELAPRMPWATNEPSTLEDTISLLKTRRAAFDAGSEYPLGMRDKSTGKYLGSTGFHTNFKKPFTEIGYWLRASETGKGYMTESAAALTKVAFDYGEVLGVLIKVKQGNIRSQGVPQRLGFTLDGAIR